VGEHGRRRVRARGARRGARGARPRPFVAGGGPWRVPRGWPGRTVVCLACGPSIHVDDVERVGRWRRDDRCRVIAVGNAVRLAPWADVLYACDPGWWRHAGAPQGFGGIRVALRPVELPNVWWLADRREDGLDEDPRYLSSGGNSGHQALNLAWHLGAARIALLGYDMQFAPDGRRHWFGDHPRGLTNPHDDTLARWRRAFPAIAADLAARGVAVINASRATALDCFPRSTIEDMIAAWSTP